MTALAIDLNDAAIVAVRSDGGSRMEPGCALVDETGVRVGVEAARAARLAPRHVDESYWAELSLAPWSRAHPHVRSSADLAYAQLAGLWSRLGEGVDAVALALHGWLRPEQARLLLGIARACEMPVVGFADAAVAAVGSDEAAAADDVDGQVLHVELGLHAAVVTVLGRRHDTIAKERVELLPASGLRAIRHRLIERLATLFVGRTRFDPLHAASSEQELWDRLPSWLDLVAREGRARVDLRGHALEISTDTIVTAVDDVYEQILRAAETCAPAAPRFLGATAARLPGLADRLASSGAPLERLPRDAAARGTLVHLEQIRGNGAHVELSNALHVSPR